MVSSQLYSSHILCSPSFCQPTLIFHQGQVPVVNSQLKTPTLNNISNITDYRLFFTTHLHQVLHADIQSDSCMVLKVNLQSDEQQKNPFWTIRPTFSCLLCPFISDSPLWFASLCSLILLYPSRFSLSLLKYIPSSSSRDIYLSCCKGVKLNQQVFCSNTNSSCSHGRSQKIKQGHVMSGHSKACRMKNAGNSLGGTFRATSIWNQGWCNPVFHLWHQQGQTTFNHQNCYYILFTSKSQLPLCARHSLVS